MYPLYVIQQGARLSIANKRVQVEKEGEALMAAPLVSGQRGGALWQRRV
jgi:hypothetical protein